MKDLRIGDEVLTVRKNGKIEYTLVYGFIHLEKKRAGTFLEIRLENGDCLKLTPNHMLYRAGTKISNSKPCPAYEISVGDSVYVVSDESVKTVKVSSIETIELTGIYAPVTYSGNLVVDGVLASCYAEYDQFKNHEVAHRVLAPLRMKSKISRINKKENIEPKEGVNKYCMCLASILPVYQKIST